MDQTNLDLRRCSIFAPMVKEDTMCIMTYFLLWSDFDIVYFIFVCLNNQRLIRAHSGIPSISMSSIAGGRSGSR